MDPLADLRDIHLPADPGWWPPAPGWWLLAAIALAALVFAAWRIRRIHRHRAPARAARRALARILAEYERDADAARATRRISTLLRRYLLARYDRAVVAGLSGARWVDFLGRLAGADRPGLDVVTTAPYRVDGGNVDELAVLARAVIDAGTRPCRDPSSAPGVTS